VTAQNQNSEMSLKELLLLLWDGRWLVGAITLCAALVGVLYALSARPVYKVDSLVQIELKDGAKEGANPLGALADVFDVNNPAETEIEIIKSRMVLGRVVETRHLDQVVVPKGYGAWQRLWRKPMPVLDVARFTVPFGLLGKPLLLTMGANGTWTLSSEALDGQATGRIGVPLDSATNPFHAELFIVSATNAPAGTRFLLTRLDPLAAIDDLQGHLLAAEVGKKTGIVQLTFTGYDAVQAARTLNDISEVYVRQNVEQKSEEAQKTLEFLQEQLPDIKDTLEQSEERLNEYRSRHGDIDLDAQAQEALDQQVAVQQKLSDLDEKRKEAARLFRSNHPSVAVLDSVSALYRNQAAQQETALRNMPLQQQELVRLMRDVQVNTELYTSLLNNSQQLKVVKAGEVGNVRVVDAALPTLKPEEPKKKVVILLSLVLGLFAGAGTVLLRRMFQGGVEDPRVVEKELGLPVYATIAHSPEQERLNRQMRRKEPGNHLLAVSFPNDLAVESLRSLRTTLHFSMLDAPNRILLLVGPGPSIGKSFVSANFATTLALAGHNVLLMDADLRRGHLHQYFGKPRGEGLSDLLSGTTNQVTALMPAKVPGLTFLSTGTLPPNPSELLLHEKFGLLLESFRTKFDYIVIDSAPVLAVTDAVIIGKLAGTTLMVLKHGVHPLAEIEACQKRLAQADVALKGVVFNDVSQASGSQAYRYGTAAYQYSYKGRKKE
jgi:tyrosine-protein kinase Etk/Wzc